MRASSWARARPAWIRGVRSTGPEAAGTAALWWAPAGWLPLLVATTIGFDFGVQATLVAHQSQVYGLEPAARSRLNAVLLCAMFVGMASGSALGGLALARGGWMAVVGLATLSATAALGVRLLPLRDQR